MPTIADLLGDRIAYRNLRPADPALPGYAAVALDLGLDPRALPRKGDPAYAQAVAAILRAARPQIARLVVVGDTRLSDEGMFTTLVAHTGWPGRCLIGAERTADPPQTTQDGEITRANRWAALTAFADALDGWVDASTVVVLDIDKTLVGARGRTDHVIDQARSTALQQVAAGMLGAAFDAAAFAQAFQTFNVSAYHPFTRDNMDYVGYLAIMVAGGLWQLPALCAAIAAGHPVDFPTAVQLTAARAHGTPLELFQQEFAARVTAHDPTPFKAFRAREYVETAAALRSGALPLTPEVWEAAIRWRDAGALLFGLSDKPDEAAFPLDPHEPPLHRIGAKL